MKLCFRILTATAVLLALLVTVPPAAAQTEVSQATEKVASKANVLITVRIGKFEDSKRVPVKSYHLVVADGTPGSKLLSGRRVPFPTGSGSGDEGGMVYQNIGFVTEARAWIVDKKTIKLVAVIEDSRISEGEDGKMPIVETRQLEVNVMLTNGVPLDLTRVEGITEHSGFVEVEASILR